MKRYLYVLLFLFMVVPAAAQDNKPLAETFVSDDERLTLRFPSGWVIDSSTPNQILVATDESMFEFDSEVPDGQGALGIIVFDDPEVNSTLFVGEDVVSKLEYLVGSLLSSSPDYVISSDVTALTLNDHPAAHASGTLTENDVFILLVDYGDERMIFMIGVAAPGNLERFEPKLMAIAETVNYG